MHYSIGIGAVVVFLPCWSYGCNMMRHIPARRIRIPRRPRNGT